VTPVSERTDYGSRIPDSRSGGGVIASVDAAGPAGRAGMAVGDIVLAVEGQPLRDIIDWQWLADGATARLSVAGLLGERRDVTLSREAGETWGLAFADAVFDGVRTCRNQCVFCFMTQLPKGLRPALYLRDDDFRLSFLQGNFITLTNLTDDDVDRIVAQRLSPLYVSLHAVDPEVRTHLLCTAEDSAVDRFEELLAGDIELHVQIVLVPGVNDGEVLDRTIEWLAQREGVVSVGIVPLGYTSHQSRFSASYESPYSSLTVIEQVSAWQDAFRERDGVTWVHLADEFYLNARHPIPPTEHYDGFPQYENGIGLVRAFADEFVALAPQLAEAVHVLPAGLSVAVVTGMLFAPVLEELMGLIDPNAKVQVLPVGNAFFGGNVSVAGLLAGIDIEAAIRLERHSAVVLVPSVVANADGLLLDDMPASELGMRSGRDVRLVSCDAGGLLGGLRDVAANPPSPKE
jgi:putative radical SAM enzyme (TIGR03279 family)